jgi:hypothetical protein
MLYLHNETKFIIQLTIYASKATAGSSYNKKTEFKAKKTKKQSSFTLQTTITIFFNSCSSNMDRTL